MAKTIWLTVLSLGIIVMIIVSFNKDENNSYFPLRYYNRNGIMKGIGKIYLDTFNVNSASGYNIDISGAAFSSIMGAHAIALRNTATSTSVPNVSIKAVTTSAVTLNFTEGNGSLINILGSNVLLGPSTAFASTSGLQVAVIVFGY